jgi:hypothetical protein
MRGVLAVLIVGAGLAVFASAEEATAPARMSAEELVRRAEDILRGSTAESKATMVVTTPRWTRTLEFHSWDDRAGDRSFTRILAPRKDRGTGFLRKETNLWTSRRRTSGPISPAWSASCAFPRR